MQTTMQSSRHFDDYTSYKMDPVVLLIYHRRMIRRRNRRMYVRPLNIPRNIRSECCLVEEMRDYDPESHFNYFRMSRERFEDLGGLLRKLERIIHHEPTHRYPIPNKIRLTVTVCWQQEIRRRVLHKARPISHGPWTSTVTQILMKLLWQLAQLYKRIFLRHRLKMVSRTLRMSFGPIGTFHVALRHSTISMPSSSGRKFYKYTRTHSRSYSWP